MAASIQWPVYWLDVLFVYVRVAAPRLLLRVTLVGGLTCWPVGLVKLRVRGRSFSNIAVAV